MWAVLCLTAAFLGRVGNEPHLCLLDARPGMSLMRRAPCLCLQAAAGRILETAGAAKEAVMEVGCL